MNSTQHDISAKSASRETLGVVTKLVAIIVATFVFAAFSAAPAQPQSTQGGQTASTNAPTPNHSR
jgi:hypothetical protein